MRLLNAFFGAALLAAQSPPPPAAPVSPALLQIKRIYVSPLTGGAGADQLRELIITGIDSTRLFILTENLDRADAVLKGAADDHTFADIFDVSEGVSSRQSGGRSSGSNTGSGLSRAGGAIGGASVSDHESHHTVERKHEAYASVRLCGKDGDVLWSTTQESVGSKFKGASADVASKIARQLSLDVNRALAAAARLEIPTAQTSASPK
jgi:hypothetical protein